MPSKEMAANWHRPLARFLGRSSRFANDETENLFRVAREMIAGRHEMVVPTNRRMRPGTPVSRVVRELAELVARSESRRLERDQRFWTLIRDLYTRRPRVPRNPRSLVETMGVEIAESAPRVKRGGQ